MSGATDKQTQGFSNDDDRPRSQPRDSVQDQERPKEVGKESSLDNEGQRPGKRESTQENQGQTEAQGKEEGQSSSKKEGQDKQGQDKQAEGQGKEEEKQGKQAEGQGITGWITGAVKGTMATLLSPITTVLGVDLNDQSKEQQNKEDNKKGEQQNNEDNKKEEQQSNKKEEQQSNEDDKKGEQQSKEDNKKGEQKNNEDDKKGKQTQGEKNEQKDEPKNREQKDEQEKKSNQEEKVGEKGAQKTQSEPKKLKEFTDIGEGKKIQLVFGGRCIAFHGQEVLVEEKAPAQNEQNTFSLSILKEEDLLVRIKGGDLVLTADRNVGILMSDEDSGKQNSFHLEKENDQFTLRVHNEQKWVGVGPKLEKKDILAKEQHGREVEIDGQPFIERNKCYQFDKSQPLEIWLLE